MRTRTRFACLFPKDGLKEVWTFEVLQNSLKGQRTSVQHDLIRLRASSLLSEGTFLNAYSETRVTGAVFSDGDQVNRHVSRSILSHWKPTSSSFHKWFGFKFKVIGQMIKIPSGSLLPQRSLNLRPLSLCAGKPNWTRSDTIVILVDLKFYFSRVIPCPWECLWVKTIVLRKVSKCARSLILPSSFPECLGAEG